jgi:hypothetical protein
VPDAVPVAFPLVQCFGGRLFVLLILEDIIDADRRAIDVLAGRRFAAIAFSSSRSS